ncbi:hypothetical protein [Pseudovibrio sp. SPO723]|uniref:hypothetical protein n=1 Tax=Nesiotobacter zosterae TaxID=392721 RepID=UPI0029C3E7F1|nr:hypothetical protein [Pseudovibrio sp. SPO723]MDX5595718.1 hypothetical protein [Pseudovibrio sp. SPO723]
MASFIRSGMFKVCLLFSFLIALAYAPTVYYQHKLDSVSIEGLAQDLTENSDAYYKNLSHKVSIRADHCKIEIYRKIRSVCDVMAQYVGKLTRVDMSEIVSISEPVGLGNSFAYMRYRKDVYQAFLDFSDYNDNSLKKEFSHAELNGPGNYGPIEGLDLDLRGEIKQQFMQERGVYSGSYSKRCNGIDSFVGASSLTVPTPGAGADELLEKLNLLRAKCNQPNQN